MNTLKKHEIFEIEALKKLKNSNLLRPLVFGGGTMLRLCYGLNRYSTDLDFWFISKIDTKKYSEKLIKNLGNSYEITDSQIKHYTILAEFRSKNHPTRLKIEIRKEPKECDIQNAIAFSPYSPIQVILKAHTLEQMMKNKIEAALDRRDIRDCFDIEFLMRQGLNLNAPIPKLELLKGIIQKFKDRDYKVTLGSVLDTETRKYYIKNKFSFLLTKLVVFS